MSLEVARQLRRRMTDAERRLWYLLRGRRFNDFKFRRQYVIEPYIADFACVEALLVIELDGGQHCESHKDIIRTAYLTRQGWHVLRFWNNEILTQTDGVLETIRTYLNNTYVKG